MLVSSMLLAAAGFQAVLIKIPGLVPAPVTGAVVARVNGIDIKSDDVASLLWESRGDEIVNELMAYALIKAEADKQGVVVTDQQVQAAVQKGMKEYGAQLPSGSDVERELAAQGLTKSRFFMNVKADRLLDGLATLRFKAADYVKVSTIMVNPPTASPADIAAAKLKVQKAADRLKAGETWARVSEDVIEDPNGKKTGGLLGWRPLSLFPAEERVKLAALPQNGVSDVIQTQFGVQLFRIEQQGKAAQGNELEELRTLMLPDIRNSILLELRSKAKIEKRDATGKLTEVKPAG